MSPPPPTPPKHVSLGQLNLSGLDLVSLDLGELAEIADEKIRRSSLSGGSPMSPDDAFFSAARRRSSLARAARNSYCDSMTSGTSGSHHDGSHHDGGGVGRGRGGSSTRRSSSASSASESGRSLSSHTSWTSQGSSRSNRSSASTNGKNLLALGLDSAEVIAISTAKRTVRKQVKAKAIHNKKAQRADDNAAAKHLRNQFLESLGGGNSSGGNSGETGETKSKVSQRGPRRRASQTNVPASAFAASPRARLTDITVTRIAQQWPGLTALAASNLRHLLEQFDAPTQQSVANNARRFEYEWRTRQLGGRRKKKDTGGAGWTRVAVRLGDFISRHVFLPKTRHLQRNGALLFVKCFNLFAAGEYEEIAAIRKGEGGFASHRDQLEAPPSLSRSREWRASTEQRRRQQVELTNAFQWLQGMATPEVQRRQDKETWRERRKSHRSAQKAARKKQRERRHGKTSPPVADALVAVAAAGVAAVRGRGTERNFESWVDESGARVWRDKKNKRLLSSAAMKNPAKANPYAGWSTIIDTYGRTLYIQPETGETLLAGKDDHVGGESSEGSGSGGSENKGKPRKSFARRAVHKVGKWIRRASSGGSSAKPKDTGSAVASSGNNIDNKTGGSGAGGRLEVLISHGSEHSPNSDSDGHADIDAGTLDVLIVDDSAV